MLAEAVLCASDTQLQIANLGLVLTLAQAKAKLEQGLFNAADHTTKLRSSHEESPHGQRTLITDTEPDAGTRLVREEAMAIAAERVAIPALLRGQHCDHQGAYNVGLCMTLTSLSKVWSLLLPPF